MEDQTAGDLSRKIVTIAAGEAHTLALTGDGRVYSWGRGMFGRLGTGSESDELCPVLVNFEFPGRLEGDRVKIVGVAAGAYHSLALSDDGSVWCWGYNIYGQLGFEGENLLAPSLMDQFLAPGKHPKTATSSPLKVCSIKAGCMMSLAIDSLGCLWMWGNIPHESSETEPRFSFLSTSVPIPIPDFHGRSVLKVACGSEHVVALVGLGETCEDSNENLELYSWGSNDYGQLGLGDRERRARPQVVEIFSGASHFTVYDLACGAHHTALLTGQKGRPEVSLCWTFGLGDNGQLGQGNTESLLSPSPVSDLPEHSYFVSVDCGLFHTSVVTSEGYVWLWGMERGLGLCPDAGFTELETGDAILPRRVNGSRFQDAVQVSCGAAHTVLVANGGYKLWSWGRGRSGVLGNGNAIDCYSPTAILWPNKPESADVEAQETHQGSIDEIKRLESKLMAMERYASLLHGSIFGKPFNEEEDIPISLRDSGYFDIGREWERMLENADRSRLLRLQDFYEHMLAGVKDKLLQRRIQEIVKDCLQSPRAPRI